jgi:23S rRNA G2445 N2-methylase RlmL
LPVWARANRLAIGRLWALAPERGRSKSPISRASKALYCGGVSLLEVNRLRLVGVAGANKVMAGELSRLARRAFERPELAVPKKDAGSIVYPFDPALAALAVRYHRTSARVLWDLYETDALRLEQLYDDVRAGLANDSRTWLRSGKLSVEAHAVEAFPAGERQVVGTVKNALIDAARERGWSLEVDAEHPDLVVRVRGRRPPRLEAREATDGDAPGLVVALDLAGRPMHERGYRLRAGEAPLREDVAALVVMLTRFDARSEALVDPMAGAGTLAIEAACLAQGRTVWQSGRQPLASNSPALEQYFEERAKPLFGDTVPAIFANELDPAIAGLLEKNAQTAGVHLDASIGDFRALDPDSLRDRARLLGKGRGVIVVNPPYGVRSGERGPELFKLYRDLGRWCRSFPGWRAGIIVANPSFITAFGGTPRIKKALSVGPLRAHFLLYDDWG